MKLPRSIVLTGGGALLHGVDTVVSEATKMPVWVTDDPLTTVVRGTAKVLDDEKLLKQITVKEGLR